MSTTTKVRKRKAVEMSEALPECHVQLHRLDIDNLPTGSGQSSSWKILNYCSGAGSFQKDPTRLQPMISTMKTELASEICQLAYIHDKWVFAKSVKNAKRIRSKCMEKARRKATEYEYDSNVFCTATTAKIEYYRTTSSLQRSIFTAIVFPIQHLLTEEQKCQHLRKKGSKFPENYQWHTGALASIGGEIYFFEPYSKAALKMSTLPRLAIELLKTLGWGEKKKIHMLRGSQTIESERCVDFIANFIYSIMSGLRPSEENSMAILNVKS